MSASKPSISPLARWITGWKCRIELLVVHRALQVRLQLQPSQRRVVHPGFEDLVAVLARFLRDVHRDVGVAEELLRALRPGRAGRTGGGDADARADEHLLAVELERRLEGREDPRRDVGGADALAAPSSRRIANSSPPSRAAVSGVAQARPEPLAHLPEQRSPAAWPSESLMVLKSSRSMNSTEIGTSPRDWRSSACSTRSRNSARFARPVIESWNA